MNTPNAVLATKTEPLRGDMRPCEHSLRPIPYPPEEQFGPIGGRR